MFDKKKIERIFERTEIDEDKYNLIEGKNGTPVLKVNFDGCSFFLNSKYNSEREGELFAKEHFKNSKNIFVYGLGMGFHIKALADLLTEGQHLYCLECNSVIAKIAFLNTEISEVLSRPNITFVLADEFNYAVEVLKEFISKDDVNFICHEVSLRCIPKEFLPIKETLDTYVIRIKSHKMLGDLLIENSKANLAKGYENGGKVFKNKFLGVPGIVVSAGPSLELNGEELKKAKGKAVIICVGRAFKYLKSIGVSPDFCIITDPKPSTIDQIDIDEKEIPLLFLSTIYPVVEQYNGPKYILFEKHSALEGEEEFSLETGGSVATTALSFAKLIGCEPLILIGQDLCYHSQKTHSGEESGFIISKKSRRVLGIDGEEYICPANLYEYLKWFRKFAQKNSDIELINCTAKGAFIEGFKHLPLDEALHI